MGGIRSTKKNNSAEQFRENPGFGCEWQLRKANLLICFAGAQLFKAFRWNVIKTGISELSWFLHLLCSLCSYPGVVWCVWNGVT